MPTWAWVRARSDACTRSRVSRGATATIPSPSSYLARSERAEVEVFEEQLGAQEIVREHLMLGLRTADGVDLARARERAGIDPLAGRERALQRLQQRGDLALEGDVLRVPHARWLHLDSIVSALF